MQVILPKQNKLVQANIHKIKPQSEVIQAEVIANIVGAEENIDMIDSEGTATSVNKENDSEDVGRKETSENKKNDSKESVETELSVNKEDVSKDGNSVAPSVANIDHLEDVGTAPSEKIDNVFEEGDGTEPSIGQRSDLSVGSAESSNNTANQICKMLLQSKFKANVVSQLYCTVQTILLAITRTVQGYFWRARLRPDARCVIGPDH